MTRPPPRGLTFVEVLVGLAILMAVGTMFMTFLTSSSKEARFSGDYFNAVVLSQKVSEDLLEEISLNPRGLETLGVDRSRSGYSTVVDGTSVFFSFLEDRAPPWGRIDPQVDGKLSNQMQPLYDGVKKYRFNVSGERLAGSGDAEDRNLLTCNIDFEWKTDTGRGEFNTECLLFSPATPKKADLGAMVDQAAIDACIAGSVYGRPGTPLPALAADIGENLDTILALGRIALISRDFMSGDTYRRQYQEIAALKSRLANTPAIDVKQQFELRKAIGRTWYEVAKLCFQIVTYLAPQFAVLEREGKFGGSTGAGFNPISLQQHLGFYRIIYEYFVGAIVQARYYYYTLLDDSYSSYKGGKAQLQVVQKLLDLYRITAIIPTRSAGMQELRDFLQRIASFSEGRNPFLWRLVRQERKLLDNQEAWLDGLPTLRRIHGIVAGRIPAILKLIRDQTVGAVVRNAPGAR